MLKASSRAALEEISGKRRAAPAAPKSDPSADVLAGLAAATRQMLEAAQLLASAAQAPAKPKKLEAIVQRDKSGKMEKVIINVI